MFRAREGEGRINSTGNAQLRVTATGPIPFHQPADRLCHIIAIKGLESIRPHADPASAMAEICSTGTNDLRARKAGAGIRRGWIRALRLDLAAASQMIISAERECSRLDMTRGTRIEADLLWAFIHAVNDDGSRALVYASGAVREAKEPKNAQAAAILCRSAYWLLGDLRAFDAIGRAPPPPEQNHRMIFATLIDRSIEAAIEMQRLRLPVAGLLSRGVMEAASCSRRWAAAALLPSVMVAQLAYEQGNLIEADTAIRAILPRIRSTGMAETAIRAYTTLARSASRSGRAEFAVMMLREGEALGGERGWPRLIAACLAERIELFVGWGRVEEAEVAFERLALLNRPVGQHAEASGGVALHQELARCRLAGLRAPSCEEATSIRRLLTEALSREDILLGVKIGVRLIAALARAGDPASAAEAMRQVIAIGCDAGLFQTILDGDNEVRDTLRAIQSTLPAPHLRAYAATLLEHWPEPALDVKASRGEKRSEGMLTPREQDVLQLMSLGNSNKRIARRLGITPETVKSHAKNIFVRLGSATRAEAVSRAASLGMI